MDVNTFYTPQIITSERKDTSATAPERNKNANPATDFLDFIMAKMNADAQNAADKSAALNTSNNAPADPMATDADGDELLASNPDIREEIKAWLLDPHSKLSQVLVLNQKAIAAALKADSNDLTISDADIKAGSPSILQALLVEVKNDQNDVDKMLAKLQTILAKLEKMASDPDTGGLPLTNLTPAQITELKHKIDALANADADDTISDEDRKKALDGIYLGLIQLISPQKQSVAALAAAAQKSDINGQINDLAATTTKTDQDMHDAKAQAAKVEARGDTREAWIQDNAENKSQDGNFADFLKDFSGKKDAQFNAQTDAQINTKTPGVKADLSTLEGWAFAVPGSIVTPAFPSDVPYDSLAAQGPALAPVTGLSNLTSLVTQTRSAAQPHPAMQVVAATISKAASNGETRDITLQLDPPELGRVEIKMSFGKDKAIKAILTAEKPETLAMLQRDAHSLERIFIDSGLSPDGGSSLSFQLAHEGYNFNRQNQDGGPGGSGSGDDGVQDIIESKMTWHVDPDTGHMRYSILA